MSLANQFRRLNLQGAAFRQAIFGTAADGTPVELIYRDAAGDHPCAGYYTAIRAGHQLEGLNLREQHEGVVRIPRSVAFTPVFGNTIAITAMGLTLRINEVPPPHPASVEWVLGCGPL